MIKLVNQENHLEKEKEKEKKKEKEKRDRERLKERERIWREKEREQEIGCEVGSGCRSCNVDLPDCRKSSQFKRGSMTFHPDKNKDCKD